MEIRCYEKAPAGISDGAGDQAASHHIRCLTRISFALYRALARLAFLLCCARSSRFLSYRHAMSAVALVLFI